MEKIVSLCKRRGFLFQSSEIYGGLQGFWDYGPLGVQLKRNVRDAWWHDMLTSHDEYLEPEGAPSPFAMTGIETSIIMHPQVWKCSGHYDLFCDFMVDCKQSKGRYRADHLMLYSVVQRNEDQETRIGYVSFMGELDPYIASLSNKQRKDYFKKVEHAFDKPKLAIVSDKAAMAYSELSDEEHPHVLAPEATEPGTLTEPREFNLMFKTIVGALGTEEDAAFLRPETAQGIFVNFKNVVDTARVKIPFGIGQIGKSFRNEITPRHFTFRSREFEQMEIEFFCHPDTSQQWYKYWRDRRLQWYKDLGLSDERLILREHDPDELSHYSTGTADVEYAFPFLADGEYGELEGIAHRGDFDLRSHMEGKLDEKSNPLEVQLDAEGKPKWKGSGKDLTYFDDQARERYTPHVIEPSAGADRATLAFICEAYTEDEQPDHKGNMETRTVMKLNPRLSPIKAAVFPLIKKEGMPEKALGIYRELKAAGINAIYSQQGAIGKRYRQQDEIGTPWCITVDGDTATDHAVTVRDRDSLEQLRVPIAELTDEIASRLRG